MKAGSPSFKLGAHQFLWKSRWTDGDLGILDAARELGLDLFEISLGDDVEFDPVPLRRRAEALGIELTVGPGNEWPAACNIASDDPEERKLGLAWHRRIIERAAGIGAAAYCGATYGHPGYVCRRVPPPEELPRTASLLRELAEFSAGLGVALVIEPMSKFRSHLVNTASRAAELVRLVDHPNLLVNLDTYHMITEERDFGAAIRLVLPVLWGLHACENDRGVPGGGLVPWNDVFSALGEAGGCVRLMLETYNTGKGGFGYSRGIFSDLCPDPERFVKEGTAFLRARIEAIGRDGR
jgi:D-psicose/D-tagatose/L-ribulose 3-epimerase